MVQASSSRTHLWFFKANESRKVKEEKTLFVALAFKPVLSRHLSPLSRPLLTLPSPPHLWSTD